MTPVEFLARIAALIPPPRYPLVRFHGVLAPRHRWRARVVPQVPEAWRRRRCAEGDNEAREEKRDRKREREGAREDERPRPPSGDGALAFVMPKVVETRELEASGVAERVGPNILSIAHIERILGGELYAASSRLEWATLLRRTFDTDVKTCPHCGDRLVIRAVVTEPESIAKVLSALRGEGRGARAPPRAADAPHATV